MASRRWSAPKFRAVLRSVVATALFSAAALAAAPAQAQFVCTFTGIDENCVNSGSAPSSPLANPNAGGKLTATNTNTGTVNGGFETGSALGGDANLINAGSVAGGSQSFTQAGGNASANNSGTIAGSTLLANGLIGLNVSTRAGGDATGVNSGNLSSAAFFINAANGSGGAGNATGTNAASGKVATFFQVETGSSTGAGGIATGTNAGSVGTFFQVDDLNANTPNQGSATGTNSGSVGQNFSVFTTTGGNAAGTNSGSVGRDFDVMAQGASFIVGAPLQPAGTAIGVNSGAVGGNFNVINTTLRGGEASGTNTGSVGGDFTVQTSSGQLAVFNSGTVGGAITAKSPSLGAGNNQLTGFVNTGGVGGSVSISTSGGGDQTFTNSGSIGGAVSLSTGNGGNMILSNSGHIGGDATFTGFAVNQSNPLALANMTMTNSGSIGGSLIFKPFAGTQGFSNVTLNNTGTIGTLGGSGGQMLKATAAGAGAVTIVNSGTINATVMEGGNGAASLTNSGTIYDPGSTAIKLISGSGANTLTLLQGSSVTGDILLNGGTVNVDASGLIAGNITGGTTLNFAVGPGTFTYGAAFGFSGFNQVNLSSGTVILNGVNSATNIAVTGGNLQVGDAADPAAKLTGTVNVSGGTLSGHGTVVGDVSIGNGATLAPGGSVGTLSIQGNLVMTTALAYLVDVSASAASSTAVTGTAALGGTVQVFSSSNSFRFNSPYTILTSAGLGGTQFSAMVPMAGITEALSYTANTVQLTLVSVLGQLTGLNANQRAVAAVLDTAFNAGGGSGPLGGIFSGNIPFNLTQAAGELGTGSQQTTFDAMNQFLGVLTDPFIAGRGDGISAGTGTPSFADENDSASAYAGNGKARSRSERDAYGMITKAPPMADSFTQRWSVWAAGFGGAQSTDGNAAVGSNAVTSRIAGTAVGADYRFSPFTIAGFALAGGGTSFSLANALGAGHSDLFQAGAYVRHTVGPAYISAALAYGWQDVTTDRAVTVAGAGRLHAEFNANAFSGRVEGGYRFATAWMGITPYAAGQFTTFDLPAYAENALSGSNAFALAYNAKSVTDTRSEFGLRTDKSFALANGILTLRSRFAWAHDFDPDRSIAATFQALPGASFVVNGAAQAPDSALTTLSAEMKWTNGWSAAATFEGEFSDVTRSYAGKGVVRYQW